MPIDQFAQGGVIHRAIFMEWRGQCHDAAVYRSHVFSLEYKDPAGILYGQGAIDATATRACGGIQRVATNRWMRRRG